MKLKNITRTGEARTDSPNPNPVFAEERQRHNHQGRAVGKKAPAERDVTKAVEMKAVVINPAK